MSKRKSVIVPEKIHLVSINIIKAHLDAAEGFLDQPARASTFAFGMAKDIANDPETNRSRYRLYFTLEAQDAEGQALGLKVEYGIEFHFYVENFQDFIHYPATGQPRIDAALGATLLGIAYSTARGIVFERTRGTFFDGILLPVIDPFKVLADQYESASGSR